MRQMMRVSIFGSALALSGLANIGCDHPGYRTEVYPGQQGEVEVRRVPIDPAPAPTVAPAAAPAPAPLKSADPDLATIQTLWPHLSPDDRKTVTDLTRRLAGQQP